MDSGDNLVAGFTDVPVTNQVGSAASIDMVRIRLGADLRLRLRRHARHLRAGATRSSSTWRYDKPVKVTGTPPAAPERGNGRQRDQQGGQFFERCSTAA